MQFIKWFDEILLGDIGQVGGKNAALGYMVSIAKKVRILVPEGFAVTAQAYWHYLKYNDIQEIIKKQLSGLDHRDIVNLTKASKKIRSIIDRANIPKDLADELVQAYGKLSKMYKTKNLAVAVRSSATAEDMPGASFAGQQESFLNISGEQALRDAYQKALSSLFTPRAIAYRVEKGFEHEQVAMSVGIQKMVRADKASSGVLFTIDTESGFKEVVIINSTFGLGEALVQGLVNPDEFWIHKLTLMKGFKPILRKKLGDKKVKVVYSKRGLTKKISLKKSLQKTFSLSDEEILELARQSTQLEIFFQEQTKQLYAYDIEWAKDGIDGKLYILQARPETVHSLKQARELVQYRLKANKIGLEILLQGQSIGQQIVQGKVRRARSLHEIKEFNQGDILVTHMTDPDWVPIMKRAGAIITDSGGRTSHAAIVSRELGILAIVGTGNATKIVKNKEVITVDCSQGIIGYVYKGAIPFTKETIPLEDIKKPPVAIMLNITDPNNVFKHAVLPVDGVGLARIEFIIANQIKFHPLLACNKEIPSTVRKKIAAIITGFPDITSFYVHTLAMGIGSIAAAFYPKFVLVRFSDFKSNEYRNLIGGQAFEPEEENPMLGLRGASRYYNSLFEPTFALECKAINYVRNVMGFENVAVMVPFVRTLQEADRVNGLLKKYNMHSSKNSPQIYMMGEVPSNIFLIREFAKKYDGISIGSNDLTQLILAVDRDSEILSGLFDERNKAVKDAMKLAIDGTHKEGKKIGICGQAPSDYPEITEFLIQAGIDSISLSPDAAISFLIKR